MEEQTALEVEPPATSGHLWPLKSFSFVFKLLVEVGCFFFLLVVYFEILKFHFHRLPPPEEL